MQIPFYQVDAFSDKPFQGNPAGVCLLWDPATCEGNGASSHNLTEEFCQKIALEKNLPATAFLRKQGGGFSVCWYSPTHELPLCGHGTLAAAHILWERGLVPKEDVIELRASAGVLRAALGPEGWIELDFPSIAAEPALVPEDLAPAFARPPVEFYIAGDRYMAVFDEATGVTGFRPDFDRLKKHRLIITAPAEPGKGFDFISRFFAGPFGLKEDYVTGSAHCVLAPYWAKRLGKSNLRAYQASARGGDLRVRDAGERVFIAGQAVTLFKGNFLY